MDDAAYNLIAVSDLHVNSSVGLAPKTINLDDGGTYTSSNTQRWLWECWLDFIEQVKALSGTKVVCFGGDLGELDTKRRTVQLITPNKATIMNIVFDTIEPMLDVVDKAIFIRGTQAHEGRGCWLEETIASDVTVTVRSKTAASWYHFQGMIGSGRFDLGHHAPMGERAIMATAKLAEVAETYYHRLGLPLPHVIQRSHNHRYANSGDNYPIQAIFTPAWTSATEYSYRIGKELKFGDIGGIIYRIENGTVTPRKIIYYPKESRRVWAFRI